MLKIFNINILVGFNLFTMIKIQSSILLFNFRFQRNLISAVFSVSYLVTGNTFLNLHDIYNFHKQLRNFYRQII